MHAIIETGGKQYKVTEGDTLFIEKLASEAGVASAHEHDTLILGHHAANALIGELRAVGCKGDDAAAVAGCTDHVDRLRERIGHHHHAGTAAEGAVVDRAVHHVILIV